MPIPIPVDVLALDIKGTLTLCDDADCTTSHKVVFQGCSAASANYFVGNHQPRMMRAYVIPYDPKTGPQLARRQKFRDGATAWDALAPSIKNQWKAAGSARGLTGYNVFMSEFLRH